MLRSSRAGFASAFLDQANVPLLQVNEISREPHSRERKGVQLGLAAVSSGRAWSKQIELSVTIS